MQKVEMIDNVLSYIKIYTGCNEVALKRIKPLLDSLYENRTQIIIKPRRKITDIEVIRRSGKDQDIQKWAEEYQDANHITYRELINRCRKIEVVFGRWCFVTQALENGFYTTTIASYLQMHHSSIVYLRYNYKNPF